MNHDEGSKTKDFYITYYLNSHDSRHKPKRSAETNEKDGD